MKVKLTYPEVLQEPSFISPDGFAVCTYQFFLEGLDFSFGYMDFIDFLQEIQSKKEVNVSCIYNPTG